MSLLRVDLLRWRRDGERKEAALERTLSVTERGIAHGSQNNG
jgi:phosphoenolpyruvate carboxylase